jgi:hypothetical protein
MDAEEVHRQVLQARADGMAALQAAREEENREHQLRRELRAVRLKIKELGMPALPAGGGPSACALEGGAAAVAAAAPAAPSGGADVLTLAGGRTLPHAALSGLSSSPSPRASPSPTAARRHGAGDIVKRGCNPRGSPIDEVQALRASRERAFSPPSAATGAAEAAATASTAVGSSSQSGMAMAVTVPSAASGAAVLPVASVGCDGGGGGGGSRRTPHRRKNWRKNLRVRTYTDILKEQVATSPALSYWAPVGGLQVDHSVRFHVGAAHRQGPRPSMEDRSVVHGELDGNRNVDLFAVFDGHGSRAEADLASAYLPACVSHELRKIATVNLRPMAVEAMLQEVFRQTSNAMRSQGYGVQTGTTAVVALITRDRLCRPLFCTMIPVVVDLWID